MFQSEIEGEKNLQSLSKEGKKHQQHLFRAIGQAVTLLGPLHTWTYLTISNICYLCVLKEKIKAQKTALVSTARQC